MNGFSLKEICRNLVNDLQTSISQKSRIKLGIDIQLPDNFNGDVTTLTTTITWLTKWLESRLINGVILIDVIKRSQLNDEIVLTVNVTGLGTKEINNIELTTAAIQFALVQPVDIRVKAEEDRLIFEFNASFKTYESLLPLKSAFTRKCILIAEDSEINALVFAGFMEEWGCEITTVDNGLEAVLRTKQNSFDLILMDINMPVMDGNEAIRKIRSVNKDIPIIALTASTLESVIREALESGANDYLLKPVASKTLFSVLQKYLPQTKNLDHTQTII